MTYCIIDIPTARIVFLGRSLHAAACCLTPGTTYGSGYSEGAAITQAMERRAWHVKEAKR